MNKKKKIANKKHRKNRTRIKILRQKSLKRVKKPVSIKAPVKDINIEEVELPKETKVVAKKTTAKKTTAKKTTAKKTTAKKTTAKKTAAKKTTAKKTTAKKTTAKKTVTKKKG